jgi:hypothetical protein
MADWGIQGGKRANGRFTPALQKPEGARAKGEVVALYFDPLATMGFE